MVIVRICVLLHVGLVDSALVAAVGMASTTPNLDRRPRCFHECAVKICVSLIEFVCADGQWNLEAVFIDTISLKSWRVSYWPSDFSSFARRQEVVHHS